MRRGTIGFLILVWLMMLFGGVRATSAAGQGTSSPPFGYGIRLTLEDDGLEKVIAQAGQLQFDWLAVDYEWQTYQADPEQAPDFQALDRVMAAARASNMKALISITGAPDWALTASGPDAEATVRLARQMTARYPDQIRALELFPGANTRTGWGAGPDPAAYADFYLHVRRALNGAYPDLSLLAGGLHEVQAGPGREAINDLDYLNGLFAAGIDRQPLALSLRSSGASDGRLTGTGTLEPAVTRQYQAARQVMLANDHRQGIIWMTGFAAPADRVGAQPGTSADPGQWLQETYLLIRSQLYIQAAFFAPAEDLGFLTSPAEGQAPGGQQLTSFIPADRDPVSSPDKSAPGRKTAGLQTALVKQLTGKTLVKKRP